MKDMLLQENKVHDMIINNDIVQDGILSALNVKSRATFIHEDEYINGIIADFTLIADDKIRSIIEVKGGNINVTDYVRGIGQIYQYEYFNEKNISPKSIEYNNIFNTVYLFPSSVIRNNTFNVGKFKYPQSAILLEVNEVSSVVRSINTEELSKLSASNNDDLVTISQYYFRDNRIFEYYILIRHLLFLEQRGEETVDRKTLESRFLKKINTINNNNWRNAFITLSSLGLINSNNLLTKAGKKFAILEYEQFAVEMYNSYINTYGTELIQCFNEKNKITLDNPGFGLAIKKKYRNRDVLFLTQSNSRYISSWLNILRDDYGIVNFAAKSRARTLVYTPDDLKDEAFSRKIKAHSVAYEYIEKYKELIRNGEF